jgi:TctA family transporter
MLETQHELFGVLGILGGVVFALLFGAMVAAAVRYKYWILIPLGVIPWYLAAQMFRAALWNDLASGAIYALIAFIITGVAGAAIGHFTEPSGYKSDTDNCDDE